MIYRKNYPEKPSKHKLLIAALAALAAASLGAVLFKRQI